MSTTKGTGGDVIVLEEAAYCDPGFFYETVAPLMLIGRTSLLAISTLTSEINFYSRLIKMKDSLTQVLLFPTCEPSEWLKTMNYLTNHCSKGSCSAKNPQEPIFKTFCVELACQKCKDAGKPTECKHMLHLVPAWQSSEKHMRLKKVSQNIQ